MAAKPRSEQPRLVTGIHRGPDRYYPHLDRTLHDGEPVPGLSPEQVEAAYYLEPADTAAAAPKERD